MLRRVHELRYRWCTLIKVAQAFQLPLKLRRYAAGAIRRARIKIARSRISQLEVRRRLEVLYHTPDPWNMASAKEQFRFARTNEILARQLIAPAPRVASILEIGCGEGHQSEHLSKLCRQLTGIDVVAAAVERATLRVPGVEWVVGDIAAQDWVDRGRRFDIVTACEVLSMFHDIPATLRLMSRLANACLVTYFGGERDTVEQYLRAVPVAGRDSFSFGGVTWTVVWWRSKNTHE